MPNSLNTLTVVGKTGTTIVQDANAIQRLQWGNLAAYTDPNGVTSPAELGIRTLDASGNIIFDTVGVAQTMKSIAVSTFFTSQNYTGGPNDIVVVGSSTTFTLTRQQTVLILGNLPVAVSPANASALVGMYLTPGASSTPGAGNSSQQEVTTNLSGTAAASLIYAQPTLWVVTTLGAGVYTADWRLVGDSTGDTWHIGIGGKIETFLMGG
jgi:hypothetical protein